MGFGVSFVAGSCKMGPVFGLWVDSFGMLVLLCEENGESGSVPMYMYWFDLLFFENGTR